VKGVILAAGRGSRLGQLTADRPKCLVPLAGRPLLAWQRAALATAGVDELAVVVGYRAESLVGGELPTFPAPRWAHTEMVGSLLAASSWLDTEPCVVSYGDIVYTATTVRRLAAAPGNLAITYDPGWARLWGKRFADPCADAETFRLAEDGALAEIGARPRTVAEVEGQYMGLLRFTPVAWQATRAFLAGLAPGQVDRLDMTSLLRALIGTGERIETVPCREGWGEVDSVSDLAVCEELVQQGRLRFDAEQEVLS
jgi:L-glutamine-phosphate cytidylyltransferase